jgi:cytochrome c oxidase subunit 2
MLLRPVLLAASLVVVAAAGCLRRGGVAGVSEIDVVAPADAGNALTIGVEARKWTWAFEHGALHMSQELVVPAGVLVHLDMRTLDEAHRLSVPSLGLDVEVKPGAKTHRWVRVLAPGTHRGVCREDCSKYPSFFVTVTAIPADEYMRRRAGDDPPAGLSPAKWGEQIARASGCETCHPIDGTRGSGGTLRGLWGAERKLVDGATVSVSGARGERYLRDALAAPNKEVVAGFVPTMPSFSNLSGRKLEAMLAYLKCSGTGCAADAACAGVNLCAP